MSAPMDFFNRYSLQETIGTGAFSEVKIAICKQTNRKVAVKIIDRSKCKGKEDMIDIEVKILSMVRHEYIVELYEIYQILDTIYLVMELVSGGELFDEITTKGSFPEVEASAIIRKILSAIDYLHTKGIVHRDLKPENLLISKQGSETIIKISDFGLSKIFNGAKNMKTACGTPGYVAPEVLKKNGYGPKVDIWSIGVITYILLVGYPPFFDSNNTLLFKKIMAGKFKFDKPWWNSISNSAKDFVTKLLVVDPQRRLSAREALNHPFITGQPYFMPMNNFGPLIQKPILDLNSRLRATNVIYINEIPILNHNRLIAPRVPYKDFEVINIASSEETVCGSVSDSKSTPISSRISNWFRNSNNILPNP